VCALRPPLRPRDDDAEEFSISLAPLVDIVFLLLVFFLLATTFMDEEKDLTLTLPRASAGRGEGARLQRVLVNVRADGTVLVGTRPASRRELYRTLVEARRANPEVPVVLRGDRSASHGAIVAVLSLCQRARVKNVSVAIEPASPDGAADRPAASGEGGEE
jgi:biopolymer transport protein ExbD